MPVGHEDKVSKGRLALGLNPGVSQEKKHKFLVTTKNGRKKQYSLYKCKMETMELDH